MRRIAIIAGLMLAGFAAVAVALLNLRPIANGNKDALFARTEESLGRKSSFISTLGAAQLKMFSYRRRTSERGAKAAVT